MPPAAAAAAKRNVLGSNKRRQPPADVYRHDHHSCAKAPRWLAGNVEVALKWVLNDEVMKGVCKPGDNRALCIFLALVLKGGCSERGSCECGREKLSGDRKNMVWAYTGEPLPTLGLPGLADMFMVDVQPEHHGILKGVTDPAERATKLNKVLGKVVSGCWGCGESKASCPCVGLFGAPQAIKKTLNAKAIDSSATGNHTSKELGWYTQRGADVASAKFLQLEAAGQAGGQPRVWSGLSYRNLSDAGSDRAASKNDWTRLGFSQYLRDPQRLHSVVLASWGAQFDRMVPSARPPPPQQAQAQAQAPNIRQTQPTPVAVPTGRLEATEHAIAAIAQVAGDPNLREACGVMGVGYESLGQGEKAKIYTAILRGADAIAQVPRQSTPGAGGFTLPSTVGAPGLQPSTVVPAPRQARERAGIPTYGAGAQAAGPRHTGLASPQPTHAQVAPRSIRKTPEEEAAMSDAQALEYAGEKDRDASALDDPIRLQSAEAARAAQNLADMIEEQAAHRTSGKRRKRLADSRTLWTTPSLDERLA
jgi:hypothetical protein